MNIRIVTTGGTIAKTYNEADGSLHATGPVIETVLARLRLPDLTVTFHHLLAKDSLDLTDTDRQQIVDAVAGADREADAVVVVHGTDTLEVTGELLCREITDPSGPIVLTGAMRPYEFRDSDAMQNVTEAMLACRSVTPGVYVAMHNRVLRFPDVVKDREALSFVRQGQQ